MEKIITFFNRFLILNKRILKKKIFLFILLLIPLSVACLAIASTSDAGIITIALAAEDISDPIASEIINDLENGDSLIRFVVADSPADAVSLVEGAEADGAWIFPENMKAKIAEFVDFSSERNRFMLIVQREDSVLLKLSHEKLNSTLYPYLSLAHCEDYIYDNLLTTSDISSEAIKQYYDSIDAEGADLFQMVYASGVNANDSEQNYLLSPARGLMAILIMLGGLAAAMFYTSDEASGVFDRMPRGRRFAIAIEYHAVAVFDVAIASLAAILLGGLSVSFLYELAAIMLYIIAVVGFCMLLRLICHSNRLLASITPALSIIMAVLCPIFIAPPKILILQYMLPPYYYLNSIYKPEFLGYIAIYSVITYAASYLVYRVRSR